jgi:hypothetical protein
MKRFAPLLLLVAMPTLVSASKDGTILARFHGDWAIGAERCAPGPADNNNIRITARRIQEFELRMDVRSVSATGEDAIIASGRITHGDAVYDNAMRLQLHDGGKVLGVGEGEDHGLYVRCKR